MNKQQLYQDTHTIDEWKDVLIYYDVKPHILVDILSVNDITQFIKVYIAYKALNPDVDLIMQNPNLFNDENLYPFINFLNNSIGKSDLYLEENIAVLLQPYTKN